MEVQEVLQHIGYLNLRDFGKEWRTRPLYRESGNETSLCIKKTTGEWYDFSGRVGGSLASLVQKTMRLNSVEEAVNMLGGDLSLLNTHNNHYELSTIKKFDKFLLTKLSADHSYWLNRGVMQSTISVFQGGRALSKGRMANRYVFPIFDDRDDLVGFSGRRLIDEEQYVKWKHLGSKSNWLYPLKWNNDIIRKRQEVILLESIGDMLSLWDAGIRNTLVTFGVDISPKIISYLLKFDIQKIVIAFNNDAENNFVGNEAAKEGYAKLCKFFDSNQIEIALPLSKDFGEMSFEQIDLWKSQHKIRN